MQLVLQHCYKTSGMVMLRFLPPHQLAVFQKIRQRTGSNMGGKTRNIAFQPFCSHVAKQVARFCCPSHRSFKVSQSY